MAVNWNDALTTRNGAPVKFLAKLDKEVGPSMVVAVTIKEGHQEVLSVYKDGKADQNGMTPFDVMNAQTSKWRNLYADPKKGTIIYSSRKDANRYSGKGRLGLVEMRSDGTAVFHSMGK